MNNCRLMKEGPDVVRGESASSGGRNTLRGEKSARETKEGLGCRSQYILNLPIALPVLGQGQTPSPTQRHQPSFHCCPRPRSFSVQQPKGSFKPLTTIRWPWGLKPTLLPLASARAVWPQPISLTHFCPFPCSSAPPAPAFWPLTCPQDVSGITGCHRVTGLSIFSAQHALCSTSSFLFSGHFLGTLCDQPNVHSSSPTCSESCFTVELEGPQTYPWAECYLGWGYQLNYKLIFGQSWVSTSQNKLLGIQESNDIINNLVIIRMVLQNFKSPHLNFCY